MLVTSVSRTLNGFWADSYYRCLCFGSPFGNFQKKGPQNRPQCTVTLVIGTPQFGPQILEIPICAWIILGGASKAISASDTVRGALLSRACGSQVWLYLLSKK